MSIDGIDELIGVIDELSDGIDELSGGIDVLIGGPIGVLIEALIGVPIGPINGLPAINGFALPPGGISGEWRRCGGLTEAFGRRWVGG